MKGDRWWGFPGEEQKGGGGVAVLPRHGHALEKKSGGSLKGPRRGVKELQRKGHKGCGGGKRFSGGRKKRTLRVRDLKTSRNRKTKKGGVTGFRLRKGRMEATGGRIKRLELNLVKFQHDGTR